MEDKPEIKLTAVYTTKETQDMLKISSSTMKRLLKHGIIRANKIGGQYRILGKELLRVISPEAEETAVTLYQRMKQKVRDTIKDW